MQNKSHGTSLPGTQSWLVMYGVTQPAGTALILISMLTSDWRNSVKQRQVLLYSARIYFLTIPSKLDKPNGDVDKMAICRQISTASAHKNAWYRMQFESSKNGWTDDGNRYCLSKKVYGAKCHRNAWIGFQMNDSQSWFLYILHVMDCCCTHTLP